MRKSKNDGVFVTELSVISKNKKLTSGLDEIWIERGHKVKYVISLIPFSLHCQYPIYTKENYYFVCLTVKENFQKQYKNRFFIFEGKGVGCNQSSNLYFQSIKHLNWKELTIYLKQTWKGTGVKIVLRPASSQQ